MTYFDRISKVNANDRWLSVQVQGLLKVFKSCGKKVTFDLLTRDFPSSIICTELVLL